MSGRGGTLRGNLALKQILNKLCEMQENTDVLNCLADIKELLSSLNEKQDFETVKTGWYCSDEENGTWLCDIIFFTDGTESGRVTEDSGIPCNEPRPETDIELQRIVTCVDGTERIQFARIDFIDGVAQAPVNVGDPIDTGIACGKQTVEVDTCDSTEEVEVDQVVALKGVVTTKPCPADVITFDTEYLCNTDTGVYDQYVVVTTNGVAAEPVVTATSVSCDEEEPDFEQVRVCNADGFIHIVTTSFAEDGTATTLSDIATIETCVAPSKQKVEVDTCDGTDSALVDQEVAVRGVVTVKQCPVTPAPVVEIDVEFVCNTDTNVYDMIVTTTTDGTPVVANPVPTTTSCDEDKPDWEVYDMCDLITSTRHTVTVMFESSGQTEISRIDSGVPCVVPIPECVESQEWTYGIDNTGTSPIDENTIEVTLSDGSSFTFIQPPQAAANSWTPQMQVWGSEIQAAADAAGLAWFVETRFRDPNNPSNLAGGGGFAGPPSVAVSNALKNMFWRYVNIQICPGQPVPVSAVIIDSSDPARIGYNLSSDGAVLGPIQKFTICRECGKEPIWYLEDGVTLAAAGQIPNCYEPCGTLALTDSPPDRDCVFQTELACDSNNSTITADFTPDITRRATICNGEQISVDYFQADPADSSALIPYTLVGRFVDCATGEEIPVPELPCENLQPMGKSRCYQTEGGTETFYANDDNTTDVSASSNSTTLKWEIELRNEADADATGPAIVDCINAQGFATITYTYVGGVTTSFEATSVIADGTTSGNWAFSGTGPASSSGKLISATITCGDTASVGTACQFYSPDSCAYVWKDEITGETIDEALLIDCPVVEECDETNIESISCVVAGQAIAEGTQILQLQTVDCNNVLVSSAQYVLPSVTLYSDEPLITEDCDPSPDIETIRSCIVDTNGVQWTQIAIIDPAGIDPDTAIYYDISLAAGTPAGEPSEWGACKDFYQAFENVKLCEVDAEYLLLIDSAGRFARYSFYDESWENVSTLSVNSAGGSADVDNFLLYNFVAPDQMTVIDVNTDTQLPNVTLVDGVINPAVATNPKTFSAASFRDADGYLYAQDTGGADAGLYRVNVTTGAVDFVTTITGVAGTGTSIMIDNSTDTLIVNGSNLSYQVDWVTGVGVLWGNPPIQPNGGTFDQDGNAYVTQGNNTYKLNAGDDPNDPNAWVQIIDDWTPGANSIAYYRVEAQQPSCFFRRFGVLDDGTREFIGDFNVLDDSPRTIVGTVDCCESSCGCESSGGGSGEVFDGNVTDVTPNPDQTHVYVSGTGNVPAGLKTVTINNITGTTTINGGFSLGQGRRVDSISFDATEIDRARGLLPAMTLSGGTWQWIGLQPIAEA